MAKIKHVWAREVLDSRGNPTLEATVECEGGVQGSAVVPSGASTGTYEAHELRDGDERRFAGKGVLKAVQAVEGEIQAAMLDKNAREQARLDQHLIELDGTPDKSRLGANAILAVSLACARAEAAAQQVSLYAHLQHLAGRPAMALPIPLMNVVNGGKHASNGLSIQEFQIIPVSMTSFAETLRAGVEVYQALRGLLQQDNYPTEVGDEGGFAPRLSKSEHVLTYLVRAIEKAGYQPGVDICLGIDAAASEFFDKEKNIYTLDGGRLGAEDLAEIYEGWQKRYPLISVEDPFHEDAWSVWRNYTASRRGSLQIVGDDLFVTNPERIAKGQAEGAASAVLIKVNQIGTLSETLQAIQQTREAGWGAIVSHRSGDTEDAFIADLCVATGVGQIKTGAPARSERVAKYNRLLAIEREVSLPLGEYLAPYWQRLRRHYAE